MKANQKIYALDYGTSNSLMTAIDNQGNAQPLRLDDHYADPTVFRSVMFFKSEKDVCFGQTAIDTYAEYGGEGRLFRSIKRFLPSMAFKATQIGRKVYSLEDLIGRFISEMKRRADEQIGEDVQHVVVGRPALFSQNEKEDQLAEERLREAAKKAGFRKVDFFPEPLAAAYEFRQAVAQEKIVLVVDLGGGTSDFTVIRLGPHKFKDSDVLALGGISVAGDALDGSIMMERVGPSFGTEVRYKIPMGENELTMSKQLKVKLGSPADITLLQRSDLLDYLKNIRGITLNRDDQVAMDRLFTLIEDNLGFQIYESVETSKREVCERKEAVFKFNYPTIDLTLPYDFEQFQKYTENSVENIFSTLDKTVDNAGLGHRDIDLICCTGGTSLVPTVAQKLEQRFGKEKIQTRKHFHSVIAGLAERAKDLISN